MGDPRKIRKKYQTPVHPWQKARIVEEVALKKQYALKNKKEIWKFTSLLKKYKDQAKKLIAMKGKQAVLEKKQMMDKLKSYGLITPGNETFDAIFSLQITDVLDRMLQTRLYKQGLARSIKQARQFIVHGHVVIGDKKMTVPRYLVPIKEDKLISFSVGSGMYSESHPERPKVEELNDSKSQKSNIKSDTKTEKTNTKQSADVDLVDGDKKDDSVKKESVKDDFKSDGNKKDDSVKKESEKKSEVKN